MTLPKKISPNPLIITTIELRFISDLNSTLILPTVLPVFSSELPNFAPSKIPQEFKSQEQFKFSPDFSLNNENFTVGFSNNAIIIEIKGDYPFWNSYFNFVKNQLDKLFKLNLVRKIVRIGVRYGSILSAAENGRTMLKYNPLFNIKGFEENLVLIRTDLKKNEKNLHLQIAKNAKVLRNNETKTGTLIDIDASYTETIDVNEHVYHYIDELHSEEKSLFFELLTDEYLQQLNPEY